MVQTSPNLQVGGKGKRPDWQKAKGIQTCRKAGTKELRYLLYFSFKEIKSGEHDGSVL